MEEGGGGEEDAGDGVGEGGVTVIGGCEKRYYASKSMIAWMAF